MSGARGRNLAQTLSVSQMRPSASSGATRIHSIVPQESRAEVELVQLELRDRQAVGAIRAAAALETKHEDGGSANKYGAAHGSDELAASLRQAEGLPQRSLRATALVRAGRALMGLRAAAASKDWGAASAVLLALEEEARAGAVPGASHGGVMPRDATASGAKLGAGPGVETLATLGAGPSQQARVAQIALQELAEHSTDELRRYRDAIEDAKCSAMIREALRAIASPCDNGVDDQTGSGAIAARGNSSSRPVLTFSSGSIDSKATRGGVALGSGSGSTAVERLFATLSLATQAGIDPGSVLEAATESGDTSPVATGGIATGREAMQKRPASLDAERKRNSAAVALRAVAVQMESLAASLKAAEDADAGSSAPGTARLVRAARVLRQQISSLSQLDTVRIGELGDQSAESMLRVTREARQAADEAEEEEERALASERDMGTRQSHGATSATTDSGSTSERAVRLVAE